MNFAEAVAHLYALGPELAISQPGRPGDPPPPRRKFDLAHMRALCAALGDPQEQVPSVLIAGTNGKGVDRGDAGLDPDGGGLSDRALHQPAPDPGK